MCVSLDRGAALMDGAKPKTDSANTSGEKVSSNRYYIYILTDLNLRRPG